MKIANEIKARLDGAVVAASVSGGKDSAALSLWLTEQGIEHKRVFLDTGWEHPATLEYLRGPLAGVVGPIVERRSDLQMRDLILKKGMFPSRRMRWCTEELKLFVAKRFIAELAAEAEVVNAVGIRRDESDARAAAQEWEFSPELKCDVWRPLIHWTLQDVIDIHKRHNLAPNPLYLWGAERVGCWPCINAGKAEIRLVAELSPERIDEIEDLEREVTVLAHARWERDRAAWVANPPAQPEAGTAAGFAWEKKRKRLFVAPFHPPAFFQSKIVDEFGLYPTVPIRKAVEWSKTKRGGKQYEMFAEPGGGGCVRWGLCEQAKAGGATNDDV